MAGHDPEQTAMKVFSTLTQFRDPYLGNGAAHSEPDLPISVNIIKGIPEQTFQKAT